MPKLTAIRKQALDELMREAIFQATLAVLNEHGVEGMTMDRVAAAAAVAKGSLYNYFPGKQALLEFVFMRLIDPIIRNLQTIVAAPQSAVEKLAAHLEMLLGHIAQHTQVFELLFHDVTAQGLLQALQCRTQEEGGLLLAEIFRQGIAEGVFQEADPRMLTHMFLGLCRGAFDTQPNLEGREQQESLQRLILNTFLKGIATEQYRRS